MRKPISPAFLWFLVLPTLIGIPGLLAAEQPPNQENGANQRAVAKLIPDQKALLGSPDTTLNLKDLLASSTIAHPHGVTNIEILKNNKGVATATLDGDQLTLRWGTEAGKKKSITVRLTMEDGSHVDTSFYVELWEPDYWQMVLTVLGGLGLFLLGMKNLSDGVQAVAGNRLRVMIGAVTDNRFLATGVGSLVTMLVQSSSITTVITVGFVSAGLMTLTQAIGVIMGANIGTTITGWILVLNIGIYGLPILGVSAFVYLFSRGTTRRYYAQVGMGLGMIFFGLELMKDGFIIVRDLPAFEHWFEKFRADSYLGVLKCVLVGCVLTLIVQSSSATLGMTIGLASIEVIPFETAAALVLGENIGTTITAWLASLGAPSEAKRAAYFHILFNTLGVAWITAVFPWYMLIIRYFITGSSTGHVGAELSTAAIAATHTGFNVINTLAFLPLVGVFAPLLVRLVPDKPGKEQPHLTHLDVRMLESPVIGIEQSRKEVVRMGELCKTMMADLREILTIDGSLEELVAKTLQREDELDEITHEMVRFMTSILESSVPHEVVEEVRRQMRIVDEWESVSDYVSRVAKAQRRLQRGGLQLPKEEHARLLQLHDHTLAYLEFVAKAVAGKNPEAVKAGRVQADAITQEAKDLARATEEKAPPLDPRLDAVYNRQILGYRRIRDHLLNIAQTFSGEK